MKARISGKMKKFVARLMKNSKQKEQVERCYSVNKQELITHTMIRE